MNTYPDFSSYGYQTVGQLDYFCQPHAGVYVAKIQGDDRKAAIKTFSAETLSLRVESFKAYEKEIEILKQVNHPQIPSYIDDFQTSTEYCLVQEYKPKTTPLCHYSPYTPDQIKKIAESTLEVLIYLQTQHPPLIHGNIKPETLEIDPDLTVYLSHFESAEVMGYSQQNHKTLSDKGTPGFIPPERIFNGAVSLSSDLYGLGATLICLMAGKESEEIGDLIDENFCFTWNRIGAGFNPQFIHWLEKLVALHPKDRYPNAQVALEQLRRIKKMGSSGAIDILYKVMCSKQTAIVLSAAVAGAVGFMSISTAQSWIDSPIRQLQQSKSCIGCNLTKAELWRANLVNANLKGAYLGEANLGEANLGHANLEYAVLERANLEAASLAQANLEGADLNQAILKNTYSQGANFTNASLKGAVLNEANLVNSDMNKASLESANFSKADLKNSNLQSASLAEANLSDANLEGVNLLEANLTHTNLVGTIFDEKTQISDRWRLIWTLVNNHEESKNQSLIGANLAHAYLQGARLNNRNLSQGLLMESNLQDSNLDYSNLEDANFQNAVLTGASLKGAYLRGTNLRGANLTDANLQGAYLKDTQIDDNTKLSEKWHQVWQIINQGGEGKNLEAADLESVNLVGAYLEGAYLRHAQLMNAKLNRINGIGANFMEANLQNASLEGANLIGANFKGADLQNVNLSRANVAGANFSEANLSGAMIEGVNLDAAFLKDAILPE